MAASPASSVLLGEHTFTAQAGTGGADADLSAYRIGEVGPDRGLDWVKSPVPGCDQMQLVSTDTRIGAHCKKSLVWLDPENGRVRATEDWNAERVVGRGQGAFGITPIEGVPTVEHAVPKQRTPLGPCDAPFALLLPSVDGDEVACVLSKKSLVYGIDGTTSESPHRIRALDASGQLAAVTDRLGGLWVYDREKAAIVASLPGLQHVTFSPDGRFLLATDGESEVLQIDRESGEAVARWALRSRPEGVRWDDAPSVALKAGRRVYPGLVEPVPEEEPEE